MRPPEQEGSPVVGMPGPQLLALRRAASCSAVGRAADARLSGLCRQPDGLVFSPRRGLLVAARPRDEGERRATPLSRLSAPKAPLPPRPRGGRGASAPRACCSGCGPADPAAAAGSCRGASAKARAAAEAAAAAAAALRMQVRRIQADAGRETDPWACGRQVWGHERPLLSRCWLSNWGSRSTGQRRPAGGAAPPLPPGAPDRPAGSHSWRPRGQPDGEGAGAGAADAAGLRFSTSFLRGWRVRADEQRARAAAATRAAVAAALAAAEAADAAAAAGGADEEGEAEGGAGSDGSDAA
ncbi:hypothetical protein Rsub_04632 [Raphidocelis subcapitata]|uniref:Uncharacterized protein n=1 Tax=Raphidocelis subcapitata TaxID=307507 RepID=A0A2V0NW83_9CHLO|nr:hypothetical protein Rsub_04632 [Raphidocelis subcapitata]|eukprot:GBF91908.1 hypothetical protein Rsub_04632 [Raphidocelis subcapitata]